MYAGRGARVEGLSRDRAAPQHRVCQHNISGRRLDCFSKWLLRQLPSPPLPHRLAPSPLISSLPSSHLLLSSPALPSARAASLQLKAPGSRFARGRVSTCRHVSALLGSLQRVELQRLNAYHPHDAHLLFKIQPGISNGSQHQWIWC